MRSSSLLVVLKCFLAAAFVAGLFTAAYFVHTSARDRRAREAAGDWAETPTRAHEGIVKLSADTVESLGIKEAPVEAIAWTEHVTVYGQVVANPRAAIDVRAPFAGTWRGGDGPGLGESLRAGQTLGRLEVRVGPQERLDWRNKLDEARRKQEGAEEKLKIQQDRVARLKPLTSTEAVSRRELDEALLELVEFRTQLDTARAAVKLWQEALANSDRADGGTALLNQPLITPADGEVTELPVRPGTAVEAGTVLLRLVDFRRVLVRLDLPPEVLTEGAPPHVALTALTSAATQRGLGPRSTAAQVPPVETMLTGTAPQVDAISQMAAFWYATTLPETLRRDGRSWRPGLPVRAEVPVPKAPARALPAVPATALLFHQGFPLVYVRIGTGRYERRDVQVLGRAGDRWVLSKGVAVGESVVIEQAQALLSEEFNKPDND
jgi:hypothetical protein